MIVPKDAAVFVRVNDAVPVTPAALAVTTYLPATLPAIAPMLACPVESVTALAADSRAVAPLAGALKVTLAPLTGCPKASSTRTRSGASGVSETAVWGEPDTTRIRAAAPAVLVSENTAGAA